MLLQLKVCMETRGLRNECKLHGSTVGTVNPQAALGGAPEKRSMPHATPTAMGEGVCPRLQRRLGSTPQDRTTRQLYSV